MLGITIVCVTAYATLSRNQSDGIYPIDADSIGIPLMLTLTYSMILLVLLLTAIGVTGLGKTGSRTRRISVQVITASLYSIALLVAGEAALSWLIPHHYTISAAYGFLIAVIGTRLVNDMRELTYNIPVERDASRPSL
jgi:hypothetical protein